MTAYRYDGKIFRSKVDCIEAVLKDDEGGFYEWIDDCFPASRIMDDLKYNEAAEVIDSYLHEYLRDTLSKGIDLESYGVEVVSDSRKPVAKRKAPSKRTTATKGRTSPARKPAARRTATKGARR